MVEHKPAGSQGVCHTNKKLITMEEATPGRRDLMWHHAAEVLGDKDHKQYQKGLRE